MKRIISISIIVLLMLTLSALAEDVSLQASVPGDAGTVELTVTLDAGNPAVMNNYSSIGPDPSAVPEPSTLALIGLGLVALVGWRRWRRR